MRCIFGSTRETIIGVQSDKNICGINGDDVIGVNCVHKCFDKFGSRNFALEFEKSYERLKYNCHLCKAEGIFSQVFH